VSIQESIGKLKSRAVGLLLDDEAFTITLILLVGIVAFGLGRGSVEQASGVLPAAAVTGTVEQLPAESPPSASSSILYIASKSGAKYHLPWCGGAKQIKEENKIYFNSKAEAEAAGYTPAANCKGI